MGFLIFMSMSVIPFVIFGIVGYGLLMKKNIYELFIKGAGEGVGIVIKLMPTLIGLMVGVGILRASGFLGMVSDIFGMVLKNTGIISELIPLIIVRLFSASAASGLVLDLFKEFGPDSTVGLTASILMSCTETVFYTMSIYFMSVKIRNGRHTLAGALIATAAGVYASMVLASMILGSM